MNWLCLLFLVAPLLFSVFTMNVEILNRRELLRLGWLGGVSCLAGCIPGGVSPVLRASKETLPKKWLRTLPKPWLFKPLISDGIQSPFDASITQRADLLALGDGWLSTLSEERLQPIAASTFEGFFDFQTTNFLDSLDSGLARKVLPVGVSPWVMLFRKGDAWLNNAQQSWQVLLDPDLKKKVILPNSPRLVSSLAERIELPNGLGNLINQTLAFDDRNAVNWLIKGSARVVVLPLNRCLSSLRTDPRLKIVLPRVGAPLDWTLLVRPLEAREPLPESWIEKLLNPDLLAPLLSEGWIPPLSRIKLSRVSKKIPEDYQSLVLPPKSIWSRCWSLPPLSLAQERNFKKSWVQSIP